ncbi:MAG: serine protease AprX [Ulvibacter sp.]|jgi:serine protease AprX
MKKLLLLFAVFSAPFIYAQQDALVFLQDKEDVATSIANPISIMTQDAIDRKTLQNTSIDERDVPVNEAYITQLKNTPGISVYAKSKWMNAVYVRGAQGDIQDLVSENYVSSVEFMDKSLNFGPGTGTRTTPDKFAIENQQSRITYNYGAAANQTTMLKVDYLHEQDFTGDGIVVAVLDSGFPNVINNPAFSHIVSDGRLLGTYDFALRQENVDGTGSHGAQTFSDIGGFILDQFVGTAPEASFYLFRTEYGPTENPVEEAWWVEALERADSLGVDVVNTSLGYQAYDNSAYDHSYEDLDGQTTIGARGANHAFDKGMILVTSAGNGGNGFGFVGTPGDSAGMLTIGAVDSGGDYVSFSSIGPTVDGRIKPDVMAQGRDAAVVSSNGNVTTSSGTSFSSPIIAGAVASLWQARPEVPNGLIMQVIRESAHLFNNPTDQMGYGIPNFEDALNDLLVLGVEDQLLKEQFAIYPNPVKTNVNISFPEGVEQADFIIYNIIGEQILNSKISKVNNWLDLSELVSGMYFATIKSDSRTNSFKLIKE